MNTAIHQNGRVLAAGAPLDEAKAAVILLHGRGSTADDILTLGGEFGVPAIAYLAPQANHYTWYPQRFIAPIEANQPYLSSALMAVGDVLARVAAAGIPTEKTLLAGFSQGACLAVEYAARHPRRYGGVLVFSGGLIGAQVSRASYPDGTFDGTPVFLGCSDVDAHIPLARVRESSAILRAMGANVSERIYPNMGHTINNDELMYARFLLENLS